MDMGREATTRATRLDTITSRTLDYQAGFRAVIGSQQNVDVVVTKWSASTGSKSGLKANRSDCKKLQLLNPLQPQLYPMKNLISGLVALGKISYIPNTKNIELRMKVDGQS